jgi:hypothetical protein
MNGKFKIGKDAMRLAIMTLATVLTWVGYAVYQAATKSQFTNVTNQQLAALDPKINTEVLDEIENSVTFSNEELESMAPPLVIETPPESTVGASQASTESANLQ